MPLLFDLVVDEVDPDVLLQIFVRILQMNQWLFATIRHESHLLKLDNSMFEASADAMEI